MFSREIKRYGPNTAKRAVKSTRYLKTIPRLESSRNSSDKSKIGTPEQEGTSKRQIDRIDSGTAKQDGTNKTQADEKDTNNLASETADLDK